MADVMATKFRIETALYCVVLLIIIAVLSPLVYGYLTTTSEQRAAVVAKNEKMAAARDSTMATLFENSCSLKSDVTGLYTQEFRSLVGKTYQTRYEPRDFQGWECKSGVTYWGLKGKIPRGFVEEHRKQVADAVESASAIAAVAARLSP